MKAIMILCLLTFSCASIPSVCDTVTDSKLCDMADKLGINLSLTGKALELGNAIAITQGAYSREQALAVMTALRGVLDGPLTYLLFSTNIRGYVAMYPGMMTIDLGLLDAMAIDAALKPDDRRILINFFDRVILSLSAVDV